MRFGLGGAGKLLFTTGARDGEQLREPPLPGIFRQAWNARFGHRDGNYTAIPF